MKAYFTKYLPVEGEIRPGDRIQHSEFGPAMFIGISEEDGGAYRIKANAHFVNSVVDPKECLKLFLCTKDNIKDGDTVVHPLIDDQLCVVERRDSNPEETALVVKDKNGFMYSIAIEDAIRVVGEFPEEADFFIGLAGDLMQLLLYVEKDGSLCEGFRTKEIMLNLKKLLS